MYVLFVLWFKCVIVNLYDVVIVFVDFDCEIVKVFFGCDEGIVLFVVYGCLFLFCSVVYRVVLFILSCVVVFWMFSLLVICFCVCCNLLVVIIGLCLFLCL